MPQTCTTAPLLRTVPETPATPGAPAPLLRRSVLRVAAGPDLGRTFELTHGLGPARRGGRDAACDLVLDDPALERLHFELVPDGGRLLVRDLDSAAGVRVGDLRLREAWLAPGGPGGLSAFRVGDTTLELLALEREDLPPAPFCHLGDLDGQCDLMRALFTRLADLAGRLERPHVLLAGEPGTGKSLAARSLHLLSHDRDAPLVTLDLRTLPEGQVERELLGLGAYPGALASAAGGTLLLAAVDELPLALQRRLAARLDGARVRLVATTRRDLQRLTAAGAFARELFAHLRGEQLVLPPLRARGRDIAFIAERVLTRLGAAESRPRRLTADALDALRDHTWPGNVRELRFVLERAYHAARGDTIGRADLGLDDAFDPRLARVSALLRASHDDAVAGFEAIYFRHLIDTHRTKVVAARVSGMTSEGFRLACRRVRVG